MTTYRKLYRDSGNRLVAGVASGIAGHVGLPVTAVRIGFVLLLPVNALGVLLYAAFWAVLPVVPDGEEPRRRDIWLLLPFAALAVGLVLLSMVAGMGSVDAAAGWLIALIVVGAGVIWHQADPDRRRRWSAAVPSMPWLGAVVAETDRRGLVFRMIGGGVLVAIGVIGSMAVLSPLSMAPVLAGLLYALLALVGFTVVSAPMLWRTFGQLRAEREGRIREQERAELAALVHDEVLHTLALIQRNAGNERTVQRLARGQERALRNWLYTPTASPTERFSAAVEEIVAEVEDSYAVAVESVVVGDRPVEDRIGALVAASREALVNAARHAGVRTLSLYAEVEPHQSSVFVRDRGTGFDINVIDHERHGVRGSIIGRMRRHGGSAEIISQVGSGTEVRLIMPTPEGSHRHA